MDDYFVEVPLLNSRTLCMGPLTRREADAVDSPVCDGVGTYLFLANAESPRDDVDVIAKIVSVEAAERLRAALTGRFVPRPAKVLAG